MGTRFDRSPGTGRRKLRAIQSLSAVIERGELISVDPDTGLGFIGNPAALSILAVDPITLSAAGVGLALAASGGLELSPTALQINLDSSPGLQLAATGLSIDLDTDPQLTLSATGLSFDDTDTLSFGWFAL